MTFGLAHKTASYAMLSWAMLAMISGGELGTGPVVLAVVGLIASWFHEAPRFATQRFAWPWTVASVGMLGYFVVSVIAGGDPVAPAATFLIWLVVARASHRARTRDWQQLYLLALLMLVAGSVLSGSLLYGICFVGFVLSTTWAMALMQLRHTLDAHARLGTLDAEQSLNSRRLIRPGFYLRTGVLSMAVFAGAAGAFLAIPRVGTGFLGKGRAASSMAGFSDGVKLGGHGVIKTDNTVVMRVEVPKAAGHPQADDLYWRGVAFDRYEGGQWSRSRLAPITRIDDEVEGKSRRLRVRADLGPDRAAQNEPLDQALRQEIYLEPLDADVLFAASTPLAVAFDEGTTPRRLGKARNGEVRVDHRGTFHYAAWSSLTKPDAEALRRAPSEVPRAYRVYLQLPPEVTERTRDLARDLTAKATNNYDKALALEDWLKRELQYTTTQADPGGQEAVDFFLFDRKRGHCEYFASAFAVLARAAGLPVRSVNGFRGGEWNDYENYVAVRAGDAHSWAEVYFPGHGWVTFDPTPGGDALPRLATGALATLRSLFDTLQFQWTKWVIDYDIGAQLELIKDVAAGIQASLKDLATEGQAMLTRLQQAWPWLIGLAGLTGLGAWGWRKRRRARQRPTHALCTQAYLRAVEPLAVRLGMPKGPQQTAREFLACVKARPGSEPYLAPLAELTAAYELAMWAPSLTRRQAGLVALQHASLALRKARRSARLPR